MKRHEKALSLYEIKITIRADDFGHRNRKCGFPSIYAQEWNHSPHGGFAEESGKEYEDVSRNLRSVGFGRNSKGDSSFLYFILLWIY